MENRENGKIGILIGQLSQVGGVGIAAIEEVRNLLKLGYYVELMILKERPEFINNDFLKDLPVRYLSRELPSFLTTSIKLPFFSFLNLFHLTFPFLAPFAIKKKEYTCLIVHETYNCLTGLSLKMTRKIPFYPFVWDPISYILPRVYSGRALRYLFPFLLPLGRFFDRLIVTKADKALVCTKIHGKTLEPYTEAGKVAVLYPGCYPLEELPEWREDFILALTKWDFGKNPTFLLEVLKRLQDKKVKLVMAGNWVQEEVRLDFLKKAEELGLTGRVELTGRADDKMKTDLFSRARVLVHPIFEAFGMIGLEAAAHGCPLIIPEKSGVTEIFQHGVHGFFPKEGDVDAFAGYLDLLLGDERKAYSMGKLAWETAKRYTWEDHTRSLLSIIGG